MYQVTCDGLLLYSSKLDTMQIFNASVEIELNKTGSFQFTVYPQHPHYSLIRKLKSIVTVYQDGYVLFRGRVLNDTIGFHNEKHISCEGELSFFLDTIKRPFSFSGTPEALFRQLVADHNTQADSEHRFTVGVVLLSEVNNLVISESDTNYDSIWSVMEKYLMPYGFITTRHENGINYIDYSDDFNLLSAQTITFGKNLLDLKRIRKGEDIVTAIIPIGKDGLTISDVNNGLDYVSDSEAVADFGFIVKSVKFDDIEDASALKRAGEAHLAGLVNLMETIELDAADLATVDTSFSSFHLGTYVRVTSDPHGINQLFLVKKITINLLNPASNKMTFGKTVAAFSDAVAGLSNSQGVILQEIEKRNTAQSVALQAIEQRLSSSIQKTETRITTSVSENYYLKGETDNLFSSVRTDFEQTADAFTYHFTVVEKSISDVAAGADAEFTEIHKYISLDTGDIILGESGNDLKLKIQNDRISFLDAGHEVAYISNDKLFITDAEFLNSLRLGNFAFVPRPSGNLSVMKVV